MHLLKKKNYLFILMIGIVVGNSLSFSFEQTISDQGNRPKKQVWAAEQENEACFQKYI